MDLHIKAYHLNHWLLSLHEFRYLHYSVTLLSRGWNKFFGVCSDLNLSVKYAIMKAKQKLLFMVISPFSTTPAYHMHQSEKRTNFISAKLP